MENLVIASVILIKRVIDLIRKAQVLVTCAYLPPEQ